MPTLIKHILLIVCLTLCSCAAQPAHKPHDQKADHEDANAEAEDEREEPLSQRIRRISPRKYLR